MINLLFVFKEWAHLGLRIIIALTFLAHGLPKLKNLSATAQGFEAMGFRPGRFWGTFIALLEGIGGFLLLIGLGSQIFGILYAGQMLVATIWKIRNGQKFINGYELDLLLLVGSLVLATSGGGLFALDSYFRIW